MQYILIVILSFSFSFLQSSTLWGCHDENAINFNPWTLWDCGDWCCEYENDLDLSIIINEINYNPASSFDQNDIDYEFIELYNLTDSDISLNGWYLNIEHSGCFTFPDILIGSNEYLILARNPETYPGSIGIGSDIFLSNTGSTISLRNLDYDIVDEVSYSDGCYDSTCLEACWPTNSDAGGSTLELIDYESDNSLASSWQDSFIVPGGTPGYANSNNDGIIYGCTDFLSCNYDPNATVDNSSCTYAEESFDCGGNCTIEEDCAGDCGGSAEEDVCGVCAGLEIDYDNCVQEGYLLSFGSVDIENGTLEIIMNNETAVAGFQFDMSGLNITAASGGSAETNGFFMSVSGSTVLGFSLSGATIPPSNGVLVNVSFNGLAEEFCLSNPILSSESGNQLDADLGDCVDGIELVYGCLDEDACNYNPLATAEGNCDYPEENVDCDGNCLVDIDCSGECGGSAQVDDCGVCAGDGSDDIGCGCFEDGPSGCDDTCGSTLELDDCGVCGGDGSDDIGCGCFEAGPSGCDDTCGSTLEVDDCGICDGDNSTCSGCTDDSAFNSNCLNGNWPNTAVFGCNEEVLISDNSCIYAPQGFEFNQSITQAFYKFINASFNDSPLIFMGSWIGAFKDGVCVGSWPWVGEFTTVPVMGDDGNEYSSGYMLSGEVPEFYIYDPLLDYSYKANTSDDFEWSNLEIFHVENLYFDFDCEEEVGGNNSYDECGVCGGDAFIDLCLGSNDCLGMDCLGICGGSEFCDSDIIYSWDDLGYTVGDVNFDHNTNVVDITNQVNFILDNSSPNYYEFWASDMNQDFNLNVIDAVNLSGHILGLMRSNINSQAYMDNKTLSISNNIGGIQFSGDLVSDVIGNDIKVSNGNNSLIYNVEGELSTKEFIFNSIPTNLLVVDLNGELLNISSAPNYSLRIYPNPFNPTTSINFAISKAEDVSISVYNLQGKEVASLINGKYNIGYHSVVWNADKYISGVYFVKIVVGEYISSQKVILVK